MDAPTPRLAPVPDDAALAPVILMYHSIAERPSPDPGTVTPGAFADQLDWLSKSGFEIETLEQVVGELARGAAARPARRVVLTFDDGYRDLLEVALSILTDHRAPATVFLVTGMLGGTAEWSQPSRDVPLLTLDEVREVQSAGVALGSHSHTHVDLSAASDAELDRELARSWELLTDLGAGFRPFSYPWGIRTDREVAAVRRHGYGCAVDIGERVDVRRPDLYRLNRVEVRGDMSLDAFAEAVVAAATVPTARQRLGTWFGGVWRRFRGRG